MSVAGVLLSVIGTAASVYGSIQESNARKKAEAARQKQAALESQRSRRETIRRGIAARALALSTATSQGGQFGSALAGGYGQISGDVNRGLLGSYQNEELGNQVFAANRAYYNASMITSLGSGLSSLGGLAMNQAGTIERL